jgi:hypothetical protein
MTIITISENNYINNYNNAEVSSVYVKSRPLKHWRKMLSCDSENSNMCNKKYTKILKDNYILCGDFDPKKRIIRSALTEKLINPVGNENAIRKYCFTHSSYLKSTCQTYNQQLSGSTSDSSDPTVRNTYSSSSNCNDKPIQFTYKPNNEGFSRQGAVSSSERIHRLKYNTITY